MIARRLPLTMLAALCGLICALGVGVSSASAEPLRFGGSGTAAGKFNGALGLGLDESSGDVYVGDGNKRVDKFDGSGHFLLGWGWQVDEEAPAEELQTCTTACEVGKEGTGAGQFDQSVVALAVDNDALSSSNGDVYVVDASQFRVQKFGPAGEFLLMFGKGVNRKTGGDVCVAGEECGPGSEGTANAQFEWSQSLERAQDVAVGPGGDVYVGDRARVQVFAPSGVFKESISLAGLSATGQVTGLAVTPAGDVFVKDSEVEGVREFEPSGVEKTTRFDPASNEIGPLALDTNGNLYVADATNGEHIQRYDPAGKETASFGEGTAERIFGSAFSSALGALYVSDDPENNLEHQVPPSVWALTPPSPGPLIREGSETASPAQGGQASVEAHVNPEGKETKYRFEYVDESTFQASGYSKALSSKEETLAGSEAELFESHGVSAALSGLTPGVTYRYRLVASNADGTATGPDGSFTAVPGALVEGPSVSDVSSSSATFAFQIDPEGHATEYRLEYGTSTSYGHVISGSAGEGTTLAAFSSHQQELQPATTYHYRLVTTNSLGTIEGPDHTFTTDNGPGSQSLPDGRAWELVSPPDKQGAVIERFEFGQIQAAADGSGISYVASKAMGENPVGKGDGRAQILARRTLAGWRNQDISIPYPLTNEHPNNYLNFAPDYRLFSPNLDLGAIEPNEQLEEFTLDPTLAPEKTIYLRNDATGAYIPIVNNSNVPAGTHYGGHAIHGIDTKIEFLGASADLSRVLLASGEALTPEVSPPECETSNACNDPKHLFIWEEGHLHLAGVLPDGTPAPKLTDPGAPNEQTADRAVQKAYSWISADGSRIVFASDTSTGRHVYVRDVRDARTLLVGGAEASFQTMSSNGSRVFFVESGDLYVFDAETGTRTDITSGHETEPGGAGVQETVLGVSEDGSYVYFVATGALTAGATTRAPNLYVGHYAAGHWTPTFIATLDPEDSPDWEDGTHRKLTDRQVDLEGVSSRVSPSGEYVTFMSQLPLTGYDNRDAVSGQRDEEVYLYNAATKRRACASCNPSGARPHGVLDKPIPGATGFFPPGELLVDRPGIWSTKRELPNNHWLAGSTPGWVTTGGSGNVLYQSRFLTNDGRLFFNSPDALVPRDTNGLEDVYEFEPAGVGGCTTAAATFSAVSGGCVDLISSGTSSSESVFLDASETGGDVFFLTNSRLSPTDVDDNLDVYDAHVCTSTVPCVSAPVTPPPCDSGDSCKAAPSPQPPTFGAPPSQTFSGAGNITPTTSPTVRPKTLTRAQRLAHALKACRRIHNRRKRAVCERGARARYRAKTIAKRGAAK
jgi:hypothetical protein